MAAFAGAAVPGILPDAHNLPSAQSGSSKSQHQGNLCHDLGPGLLQPGHCCAEPLPQHQHHTGSSSPCRALAKLLLLSMLAVILLALLAAGILLPASLQMQRLGGRWSLGGCSVSSSGEVPSAAASSRMPAADCQVPTWLLHVMKAARLFQDVGGSLPAGLWCRMQIAAKMHHATRHAPLDSPDVQSQTDSMTGHQPSLETAAHPDSAVINHPPLAEPQHKAEQFQPRDDLQQQSAEQHQFSSLLDHPGELEAQASQLLPPPDSLLLQQKQQQQQQQPEPMQQQQLPEPMQQQPLEPMQRPWPCGPHGLQDCPVDLPQQQVAEQQDELHPSELALLSCSQLAELHPQLASTLLGMLLRQHHDEPCGERASAGEGVGGEAMMLHAGAVSGASSAGLGLVPAEEPESELGQHVTEDTLSECSDSMAAVPASAAATALHKPVQALPDDCPEGSIPQAQMVGDPPQQATHGSCSKPDTAAEDSLHGLVTKLYSAAALQTIAPEQRASEIVLPDTNQHQHAARQHAGEALASQEPGLSAGPAPPRSPASSATATLVGPSAALHAACRQPWGSQTQAQKEA